MPEPINPEGHSCAAEQAASGSGTAVEGVAYLQAKALQEAIHQTFERDAESVERWNTAAETSEALGESIMPFDAWAFSKRIPDPDTEIDRLARLIVDGEYRRRSQADA